MAIPAEAPTRALPPPAGPQAGWYPDPYGWPVGRYFDGRMWTHHTTAVALAPAVPEPHAVLPLRVAIGAVAVLAVSLIADRLLIDALVDLDWSIVVYASISVLVGYGDHRCGGPCTPCAAGGPATLLGGISACGSAGRTSGGDRWWWLAAGVLAEIGVAIVVTMLDIPFTSNTEGIGDLDVDRTYVITLLVTAVIAAPIVEEMIFRGLMLRGPAQQDERLARCRRAGPAVRRRARRPGAGDGQHWARPRAERFGIVFGGAAYLLRRIGPTIFAHAIFNAVVMVIVLTVELN